ncbi:hypothetical protein ACS4XW_20135, partial [Escherichia coli]|uniref:hypothetical protein n=1 Tax=Escherichia coli TaxID=562 RepID=UPI003F4350CE
GGTADRNRSHWSTSKTPSYTKSVSWQHHRTIAINTGETTMSKFCFTGTNEELIAQRAAIF